MKKAALFASILALALGARAQSINFAGLPAVSNPTLLPSNYANLNWSGFYYVDPIWTGAGVGFKQGPNSLDVAYMGGGECEKAGVSCSASISSNASAVTALGGFKALSAIVAGGYHSEIINVSAYNRGHFVGSQSYNLSTSLQQINFPTSWGMATQLVMDTNSGTLVLYALNLQSVGAGAQAAADAVGTGANAVDNSVGPTAPIRVSDPPKGGDGGSAGMRAGPVVGGSENTFADSDIVKPPIIVIGPSAPKQPGPVAHESDGLMADNGTVQPIAIPPTAPKKPGPVAHESNGLMADNGKVGPVTTSPTAPKKVGPVTHESETVIADSDIVKPPIIVIGPSAPKQPGPVAHESDSASV